MDWPLYEDLPSEDPTYLTKYIDFIYRKIELIHRICAVTSPLTHQCGDRGRGIYLKIPYVHIYLLLLLLISVATAICDYFNYTLK